MLVETLLIADHSIPFLSALEAALSQQFHIRTCMDGNTALELLESFHPDVLIMNLMLPYRDGFSVLQQTSFQPRIILAITPYLNRYIIQTIRELGIDYTMISPSVKALCARLQDLIDANTQPVNATPTELVCHHLDVLGLSAHLSGYRQLCVAIPLFAQNPNQFITKELYPAVSKLCGCSNTACVEHSIRKAIRTAWSHGDIAAWRKYFAPGTSGRIRCPSNKEFICRMAEILQDS